jgi:YVTN family beta-propeller protein
MKKSLFTLLAGAVALAGCDNPKDEFGPLVPSAPGVYVLNEGAFGQGGGIVSAYGISSKTLLTDAFGSVNKSAALGDVVQDMGVVNNRGYICVNASNKVEVVNVPDFSSVATIRNIRQPRYFASTSATRGYVTAWRGPYTNYAPGKVMVLDLTNNTVIDSITVGRCPEQLTVLNNTIYVPNSYDNTVSVIDANTNRVTSTVTVAAGPQCGGRPSQQPVGAVHAALRHHQHAARCARALHAGQQHGAAHAALCQQWRQAAAHQPRQNSTLLQLRWRGVPHGYHCHGPAYHALHAPRFQRLCHRPAG